MRCALRTRGNLQTLTGQGVDQRSYATLQTDDLSPQEQAAAPPARCARPVSNRSAAGRHHSAVLYMLPAAEAMTWQLPPLGGLQHLEEVSLPIADEGQLVCQLASGIHSAMPAVG